MFRYLRFYIGPMTTLFTAPLMYLGGFAIWVPSVAITTLIASLDQMFPHDVDEKPYEHPFWLDLALYLATPTALLLFFQLFWLFGTGDRDAFGAGALFQALTGVDAVARRNDTDWYHFVAFVFAMILPLTGAGGLAGHELTHRTWRPFDLWLGRVTMALNWGIAFPIEHVYGHHTYVGTMKDPATAARGDSVYQHLPKAMKRTVVNAIELESARLKKLDKPFFSPSNVLLRMGAVSLSFTGFAYYCAGWAGVGIHVLMCVLTKVALEVLNYIEHYGLLRVPTAPVQPRHSWNCNHVVSGVFTYNLTRHSHHHDDAQVPFQDLRAHPDQPEMPGGFMTAYLTALVPPLFRRAIAPRLLQWDRIHADPSELPLIREANKNSGWPELAQSVASTSTEKPAIDLGY